MRGFWIYGLGLALLATVGCSHKETYQTPGGTVQVEHEGGGNVKITSKDGTVQVDQNKKGGVTVTSKEGTVTTMAQVDVEKTTGLPAYPGATQEASFTATQDGGQATVTLKSGDSVDKVADFYKKLLPQANVSNVNAGGNSTVMLQGDKNGRQLIVAVTSTTADKNTHIQITSVPSKPSH